MKSKILILSLLLLTSCGGQGGSEKYLSNENNGKGETQEIQSCRLLNLLKNLSFTGDYLTTVVSCFNSGPNPGQLVKTIEIIEIIGKDNFNQLAALISMTSSKVRGTQQYPLLRALARVTEREQLTFSQRKDLNTFLKRFDPAPIVNKLLDLHNNKQLIPMLGEFSSFLKTSSVQVYFSVLRKSLEDEDFKADLLKSYQIWEDGELYNKLERVFRDQSLYELSDQDIAEITRVWSRPARFETKSYRAESPRKEVDSYNAHMEMLKNIESVESEGIKKIGLIFEKWFEDISKLDDDERPFAIRQAIENFQLVFDQSYNFIRTTAGLFNTISNEKANGLDGIVADSLDFISEPSTLPLKTINLKVSESKIKEELISLLAKGGRVIGCKDLVIPPFTSVDSLNKNIRKLSEINNSCRFRSGLMTFIIELVQKGAQCSNSGSDELMEKEVCFNENEVEKIRGGYKTPLSAKGEVVDGLGLIIKKTFKELSNALSKDSFYLYWRGLSHKEVNSNVREKVLEFLEGVKDLESLKRQESLIQDRFPGLFPKHFLYKLISLRVENTKAAEFETQDIFTLSGLSDSKMNRILYGNFENSYLTKAYKNYLYSIAEKRSSENKDSNSLVSEFDIRKMYDPLLRSFSLGEDSVLRYGVDFETEYSGVGSPGKTVYYDLKKRSVQSKKSRQIVGLAPFIRPRESDTEELFISSRFRFKEIFQERRTLVGLNYTRLQNSKIGAPEWFNYVQEEIFKDFAHSVNEVSFLYNAQKETSYLSGLNQADLRPTEGQRLAFYLASNQLFFQAFPPSKDSSSYLGKGLAHFGMLNQKADGWSNFQFFYPRELDSLETWSVDGLSKIINSHFSNKETYSKTYSKNFLKSTVKSLNRRAEQREAWGKREEEKLLSFLNLGHLLGSIRRAKSYSPIIGLNNKCLDKRGKDAECFFDFGDKSEEASKYTSQMILAPLCAYSYAQNAQKVLTIYFPGLLEDKNFKVLCKNKEYNYLNNKDFVSYRPGDALEETIAFPKEFLLNNALSILLRPTPISIKGDNSTLGVLSGYMEDVVKQSLGKIENKIILAARERAVLLNGRALRASLAAEHDVNLLTLGRQDIFSSIMKDFNFQMNGISNEIAAKFERLQEIYGSGNPWWKNPDTQGDTYDFTVGLLIGKQKEFSKTEVSTLRLGLELISELAKNPKHLDILARLSSFPRQLSLKSVVDGTFRLMLTRTQTRLEGLGEVFSWDHPDLKVIRQLLTSNVFKSALLIFDGLSFDQTKRLLKTIVDSIHSSSVEFSKGKESFTEALNGINRRFVRFLSATYSAEETLDVSIELREMFQTLFSKILNENEKILSLSSLSRSLSSSFLGFDGIKYPSLNSQLNEITDLVMGEKGILLARAWQKAPSGLNAHELLNKLILPSREASIKESKALSEILRDPVTGQWDDLWKPLIFDPSRQDEWSGALLAASKIKASTLRGGVLEGRAMLDDGEKFLNFLQKKVVWGPEFGDDPRYILDSVYRLSQNEEGKWDDIESLFLKWTDE